MSFANFGAMIKFLREEQWVSQERLAFGLMSRENLSNIERGMYVPSKDVADMLLSRLGVSVRQFAPYYLKESDFEAYELCGKLKYYLNGHFHEAAENLLQKMSKMEEFAEGLMRQTYLHGMATLCLNRDNDSKSAFAYLNEAIKVAMPEFNEKKVYGYLLSNQEIELIASVADIYELEGKRDDAIFVLNEIAKGIRFDFVDPREKARSLAFVLYNLTSKLNRAGKYAESLKLCEEAITECEAHGAFDLLPVIKYNQASNLFYLGEHDKVKNLVYQAYYGCLAHGDNFFAEAIKEQANEDFGIVFE